MSGKNATETLYADAAGIARAARIIRDGGIVAVPTETVYGLAARADSDAAVARIYAAKGRPEFNPLIVHVGSMQQAAALAEFSDVADSVARRLWPGPLTLVLPRKANADLAAAVSAGLPTVALRMPAHPVMRALIDEVGLPLAAPSANRSNAISPTAAVHVSTTLDGRIDLILDGGACESGLESTILAIRHDGSCEILRPGPIGWDDLPDLVRAKPTAARVEAPGQLAKHYSPGKPLRLAATAADADEFLIGFGPVKGHFSLSASGDLAEAAGLTYAALHEAAASPLPRIAVAPIPEEGIGIAINDRLRRAAA